MPIWRMQCEMGADSTLPRDALTITPHFNDGGIGSDPQGLTEDLAVQLEEFFGSPQRQIKVTAYDAQGTPPVAPAGVTILHSGSAPTSQVPREIAVCLSFYSQQNVKRRRGRLFLPFCALPGTLQQISGRPNQTTREGVGALAQRLADLGGADVDWSVYSRVDDVAYPISNWWVDDEWDTQRSRGLRSTTRSTGTVSE